MDELKQTLEYIANNYQNILAMGVIGASAVGTVYSVIQTYKSRKRIKQLLDEEIKVNELEKRCEYDLEVNKNDV